LVTRLAANRIDRPGTSHEAWASWPDLRELPPADLRVPWHRTCRILLPAEVETRKRSTIRAFASQLTDRGPALGPVLPAGIVAHFTTGQEVLLR
jgi:hypothetical protein